MRWLTLILLLLPVTVCAEVTLMGVQDAAFGTIELFENHVKFTPKKDFYGADRFQYTIRCERTGRVASGWFYIAIHQQPEPLIAGDVAVDINEDSSIDIPIDLILSNNNADDPDPHVTNPPGSLNIPEGLLP